MKKVFLIILITVGLLSCSDSEPQILNGILTGSFIEVSPENNRTILIFSSEINQLQEKRVSDRENSYGRSFSIRLLNNNLIELSSNEADESAPRVIHYLVIDNNNFEIGNLNSDDPEETIMIFERN
mgnify:CR=1 FL=1